MQIKHLLAPVLLSILHLPPSTASAQGTAFVYQGQLSASGSPANGNYDFTFALFDNSGTNSGQIGRTLTNLAVGVTNGLFTSTLDFGAGVFTGTDCWLAIGVRTNGSVNFAALNPLQELTPAPYAIYAPNAGSSIIANSVAATNITGAIPLAELPAGLVTNYITNGSSYAQLSNAVSHPGSVVELQPGSYLNMSNLAPASSVTIRGNGAVLHFSTNCSGFFIDCWPNAPSAAGVVSNFVCLDLMLSGDAFPDYDSPAFLHPAGGSISQYHPYFTGQQAGGYINRHGLRLNCGAPGRVEGCTVLGFGGYGVFMGSPYGQGSYINGYKLAFANNSIISNWYGLVMAGEAPGFEWGQPGGGSSQWPSADYSAQFQLISSCCFDGNSLGVCALAGNEAFVGCDCSGCQVGFHYNGNAHGAFTGGIIEHDLNGVVGRGAGMRFTGNLMLADATNFICDSVLETEISDNKLNGDAESGGGNKPTYCVFTNSLGPGYATPVVFAFNTYVGPWSYGPGAPSGFIMLTNMNSVNLANQLAIGANVDYSGQNTNGTDGSILAGLLFTNSLAATSIAPAPAFFTNLLAFAAAVHTTSLAQYYTNATKTNATVYFTVTGNSGGGSSWAIYLFDTNTPNSSYLIPPIYAQSSYAETSQSQTIVFECRPGEYFAASNAVSSAYNAATNCVCFHWP